MIEYKVGNLFDSKAEAFVNCVNCIGIMGGGIALEFRNRYPSMFSEYKHDCWIGCVRLGSVLLYKNRDAQSPKWIINYPTKGDLSPSRLSCIVPGLRSLVKKISDNKIKSVAMPKLGCGLGGLRWADVKPLIEQELKDVDCLIEIYV